MNSFDQFWGWMEDISTINRGVWPVYLTQEIDVTALDELRKTSASKGSKISYTGAIVRGLGLCFKEYSQDSRLLGFNSTMLSWPWQRKITFDQTNVGVMVQKEVDGVDMTFMVVLKEVDKLTAEQVTEQLRYYSETPVEKIPDIQEALKIMRLPRFPRKWIMKAVANIPSLRMKHWGSFCVTTVGKFGVDMQTPATGYRWPCFGFGLVKKRAVVINDQIQIRPTVYLSCVFDRRVMNGAYTAKMIYRVKEILENPEKENL